MGCSSSSSRVPASPESPHADVDGECCRVAAAGVGGPPDSPSGAEQDINQQNSTYVTPIKQKPKVANKYLSPDGEALSAEDRNVQREYQRLVKNCVKSPEDIAKKRAREIADAARENERRLAVVRARLDALQNPTSPSTSLASQSTRSDTTVAHAPPRVAADSEHASTKFTFQHEAKPSKSKKEPKSKESRRSKQRDSTDSEATQPAQPTKSLFTLRANAPPSSTVSILLTPAASPSNSSGVAESVLVSPAHQHKHHACAWLWSNIDPFIPENSPSTTLNRKFAPNPLFPFSFESLIDLSQTQLRQLWAFYDTDGDGFLKKHEIYNLAYTLMSKMLFEIVLECKNEHSLRNWPSIQKRVLKEKSFMLPSTKSSISFNAKQHPGVTKDEYESSKKMFIFLKKKMDLNQDGKISMNEFFASWSPACTALFNNAGILNKSRSGAHGASQQKQHSDKHGAIDCNIM